MLIRPARFLVLAVLFLAPTLIAQVPSASDPPKYSLPPQTIIDAFDAESLPQTMVSPNKQVVALIKARRVSDHRRTGAADAAAGRLAHQSEDERTASRERPSGNRHLLDHASKDCRRGGGEGHDAAASARSRNLKFSPDGSRLSFLQTNDAAHRTLGRRRRDGQCKGGGYRIGSHQRDHRRSVRLAPR